MRNVGVALFVATWILLVFTSSVAPAYVTDTSVVLVQSSPRLDTMMLSLAIAGIALAVFPVRRGERWALLTQIAMLITVLVPRLSTGTQRLAVIDPHQQSHTFAIATVLAVAGLVLTPAKRALPQL
jgi:hypothetical protein